MFTNFELSGTRTFLSSHESVFLCRLRETSSHEDLFASDDEEFAEVASQMDVSASQNHNGLMSWGVWTSQESSDENSFEHFASQLPDSQLNGITDAGASHEPFDDDSFEHFASQLTDSQLNRITDADAKGINKYCLLLFFALQCHQLK